MGTTSDALRTQTGVVYCYVLVLEGYDYLLTDHADAEAVVTAWAATDWSACLPGLRVGGPISQRFKPWQTDLDVQTLQVSVVPDEGDTFGRAVFKAKATYNTRLTQTFQPAADGSGVMNVKSTTGLGASGSIYVGGQKHDYSSKTATTLTLSPNGASAHSPFTAQSGNHLGVPAPVPQNVNGDVAAPPRASSAPTRWTGRKAALYIHRIVDGVLDTKAQAQLEFAGVIRDISDAEDGSTVLEFEDMRAKIRDAVILQDQWIGHVKPGVRLIAGTRLEASELPESGSALTSAAFTVVSSGAAGANQINAGTYEIEALRSALTAWLAADATLVGEWNFAVRGGGDAGVRFEISARFASGATRRLWLKSTSANIFEMLGFSSGGTGAGAGEYRAFVTAEDNWFLVQGWAIDDSLYSTIVSGRAPYKAKFLQNPKFGTLSAESVVLETSTGTFFNQLSYLPPALRLFTSLAETWGIFQVGNGVYLGRLDDATHISGLSRDIVTLRYVDSPDDPLNDGLAINSEEDRLAVRQCLLLEGSFTDIVTKLIASIPGGTSGVNHTTYDVFPWGAGVPWSLLGDNWVNSCNALEEALNSKSITALVTQPTRLLDVLISEFALRGAWMRWKDEGYQLATLPTPNATTADHDFDETNKADPGDTSSAGRTVTQITNEYLRNIIKLEYARDATGKYRRSVTAIEQASVTEYGGSAAKTIQAVNSFGEEQGAGASVEEMIASLVSKVFPKFAKPLCVVRRSIAPTLFHVVPGDTGTFSDVFARDPTSGERGVANRACVVLSVSYDRGSDGGQLSGEVELLVGGEDRHYAMAPAAEIDTAYSGTIDGIVFVNGYSAAGTAIKLKDHAYSRAADALDVTRFAATDALRIVRLDDGVSGDAWSRTASTVDAVDGYIILSAALTSPAWTSAATERYRVQYQNYSACTASQRLRAFQADDSDGLIQDLAEPNTYGEQQWQSFGSPMLSSLPILPAAAEYWGDGKPFHAGLLHDISLFNNNLPNYRCAPNMPVMLNAACSKTTISVYVPVFFFPVFIGPAATAGLTRKLMVAPMIKTSNASNTCSVRVTTSASPPIAGGTAFSYTGPTKSVTFTTTSTTLAEATAQSLTPMRGDGGGSITWLSVELKSSAAVTETSTIQGISRLYLGPLEAL